MVKLSYQHMKRDQDRLLLKIGFLDKYTSLKRLKTIGGVGPTKIILKVLKE